jgi:uncharacterized phage protein (TIGR02216 family)
MIPWEAWMAHGLGVLRLDPHAFWRLSLKEWRAVTGASANAAPNRAELIALMKEHPDVPQ